jgi:hypothetical protein
MPCGVRSHLLGARCRSGSRPVMNQFYLKALLAGLSNAQMLLVQYTGHPRSKQTAFGQSTASSTGSELHIKDERACARGQHAHRLHGGRIRLGEARRRRTWGLRSMMTRLHRGTLVSSSGACANVLSRAMLRPFSKGHEEQTIAAREQHTNGRNRALQASPSTAHILLLYDLCAVPIPAINQTVLQCGVDPIVDGDGT